MDTIDGVQSIGGCTLFQNSMGFTMTAVHIVHTEAWQSRLLLRECCWIGRVHDMTDEGYEIWQAL